MIETDYTLLVLERQNIMSKLGGKLLKLIITILATYGISTVLESKNLFLEIIAFGAVFYFLCSLFGFCSQATGNYFIGGILTIVGMVIFAVGVAAIGDKFYATGNTVGDTIFGIAIIIVLLLPLFYDVYKIFKLFAINKQLKSLTIVAQQPDVQVQV